MPQLLKGEYSEQVSTGVDCWSIRQPLGVVAGITPFNFPAMVPMWMFPIAIACGNTSCSSLASRTPRRPYFLAELWAEAGLPDGVFNVVHGDKEAVDALLDAPRRRGGVVRRLDARSPSTSTRRHAPRQARAGARRRQEPHGRAARRRHRPGRRRRSSPRPTARPASAAWRSRSPSPSARPPTRCVAKIARAHGALQIGPGTDRGGDMGPLVTERHRDSRRLHRRRRAPRAPSWSSTAAARRRRPRAAASSSARRCSTASARHARSTTRRSSVRCSSSCASTTYAEALALVNATRFGNGAAIFTNDGGAARALRARGHGRHGRHQRADPGADGLPLLRRLEGLAVRRPHMHGPEGVRFYTRGKVVTPRWPDPSHRGVNLGFPVAC